MKKKNKRYFVNVYFNPLQIDVVAKNENEARQKAYARIEKKKSLSLISKKDTSVNSID